MTPIDQLRQMVQDSNYIVFFGGAGVSTESGIPDFRSTNGLYNQQDFLLCIMRCWSFRKNTER